MEMQHLTEIFKYLLEILAVLGITVEIIPVKFSPIRWIGSKLNNDIKEELKEIRKELDGLKVQVDRNDIRTIRNRISTFENLVRLDSKKQQLKRHQYTTAFKDIDKWNRYHEKYDDLNGELKLAIENIEKAYKNAQFTD